MTTPATEQRRFHRIEFDAACEVQWQEQIWQAQVLDISLKGVLLRCPSQWAVAVDEPCEITVFLNGTEAGIVMAVVLRHVEDQRLGFQVQYIDMDSATHLRRLVELNLGDPALLERELGNLLTPVGGQTPQAD
ncbi:MULTISPECIES: PilZ domain-containing protein [unclassified Marinobacter]|uniref:PilZ domain-containing protein n=1 Tax=unclassified Marinobacter TaxID=83889 RepID=UPI002010C160|nr:MULTISPECIES: PilZ domain-containing protein [unclassified Marinobacter]UQG56843.1 PilZ domain-containing protein [Marinobacter sp. M4C]UQG65647.1 PilZ domain-containing protein [Marinobacter sp. M2C]UQG69927.1 PilZ domain-containing protein [Marinobacter sp. M1C]